MFTKSNTVSIFSLAKKLYNYNGVRTLTMTQMRSEFCSVRVVFVSLLENLGIIEFEKCGKLSDQC